MTRRAGFVVIAVFGLALGAQSALAAPIGSPGNYLVIAGSGIVEFDAGTGQQLGSFVATRPNDFVFSGGRLYATDPSDHIIVYDAAFGAELGSLAGPATLHNASSIAVDSQGDIVLLNRASGSVSVDRFTATGDFETSSRTATEG